MTVEQPPGSLAKDSVLATLAHELRNMLYPIYNVVALARVAPLPDAMEIVERQATHMGRLVDDLLDLSCISQGIITLAKARLDLVKATREAARMATRLSIERASRFVVELPSKPLWMDADPVRIGQIVTNLLNNAEKYGGDGKIYLSLAREGGEAVLTVRDEGIGIAPDMLERIFEPFVQVSRSRSARQCGLGLGLPLVRSLVHLHGGWISVQSPGLGEGAKFVVRLPLSEPPAMEADGADPRRPSALCSKRRVLVVEDSADLARTLSRIIAFWGHTVETVGNGAGAVAKAVEFAPHVALVDLALPDLDGCEVARQFLAAPSLNGLRIIAMSGYCHATDRERAAEAGFHEYLLKPVNLLLLKEKLQA